MWKDVLLHPVAFCNMQKSMLFWLFWPTIPQSSAQQKDCLFSHNPLHSRRIVGKQTVITVFDCWLMCLDVEGSSRIWTNAWLNLDVHWDTREKKKKKKLEEEVGWQQKSEGKFIQREGNRCVMYNLCALMWKHMCINIHRHREITAAE